LFRSSAPGRIGILGNPSDIYGGKVIAMAIQYRTEIFVNRSNKFPIEVSVRTEVPRESGMGGSTAIIVAFLDACRKMFNLTYDNYRLAEITQKVEHKDLGITAGYNDRYSISFGGLLFMDFTGKDVDREVWEGEPYAKIRTIQAEIPLVCGYWGVKRSSGNVHAIKLTEKGEEAIIQSDWKALGELMNENHEIARKVGWAYPIDDKLRNIGLKSGATAAKLGGAGNGGVMVFLAPRNRKRLMKALMDAGAKVFIPKLSEGVH